jgi:hypothetical protein
MTLYSSINRGIYGHVAGAQLYSSNIFEYIHRLHVTDEYSFIFLDTNEYNAIYWSALYSSIHLSVNRGT